VVVVVGVPATADVQTAVEAGPDERGRRRYIDRRSLAGGEIGGERRAHAHRHRDSRSSNYSFHVRLLIRIGRVNSAKPRRWTPRPLSKRGCTEFTEFMVNFNPENLQKSLSP